MRERRWGALGKKIDPSWGRERERSVRVSVERRATRRRSMTRVAGSLIALSLVAGGAGAFVRMRAHVPAGAPSLPAAPPPQGDAGATGMGVHPVPDTGPAPLPGRHARGLSR